MANNKGKVLSELRTSIVEQIGLFNKALKENDFSGMARAEAELKEVETQYGDLKATEIFDEVAENENPIKAGIIKYWYPVLSHKNIREDGRVVGIELIEDRMKQIDLIKLAKYCNIKSDWQYTIEKFNQLLCLRAAHELKLTKAQIEKISNSFYMNKLAKAVEFGETPDSNTQICKQLQKILDEMVFEENGKGKNVFKVNNHDVAYLLMCYTKKGRNALSVATAKHSFVNRLIMDVEHRAILEKQYDLEYKVSKDTAEMEKKKAEKGSKKEVKKNAEEVTEVAKK